jgi:repressor LexA
MIASSRAGAPSDAPRGDPTEWLRPDLAVRPLFAYEGPVLTRRQQQVLDFVERYIGEHRVAPTLHEIGRHLKLSSVATVHKHLRRLEEKGAVRRLTHQSRALAVVPPRETTAGASIPLLGIVAAGAPIEPVETPEAITVPEELLGRGETFALRVRGDSMIDDGIREGDVVIVESRKDAEEGATVVALVNGEATVKRFHRKRGRIHLVPANARMEPIVAREGEVEIRGVVVGLVRRYRR